MKAIEVLWETHKSLFQIPPPPVFIPPGLSKEVVGLKGRPDIEAVSKTPRGVLFVFPWARWESRRSRPVHSLYIWHPWSKECQSISRGNFCIPHVACNTLNLQINTYDTGFGDRLPAGVTSPFDIYSKKSIIETFKNSEVKVLQGFAPTFCSV